MGGYHGTLRILENKGFARIYSYFPKAVKIAIAFSFVTIGWVFFRADSFRDAFYVVEHMLQGLFSPLAYVSSGISDLEIGKRDALEMAIFMTILISGDFLLDKRLVPVLLGKMSRPLRWASYLLFILVTIFLIPVGTEKGFIYFQF